MNQIPKCIQNVQSIHFACLNKCILILWPMKFLATKLVSYYILRGWHDTIFLWIYKRILCLANRLTCYSLNLRIAFLVELLCSATPDFNITYIYKISYKWQNFRAKINGTVLIENSSNQTIQFNRFINWSRDDEIDSKINFWNEIIFTWKALYIFPSIIVHYWCLIHE